MEQFYSWIQTIIFYMIFMNFMTNLLPGKAYARYVRLFMGMVLILLVIRPLTGSLRLDEQLARRFEEISFQKEAGELQGQLEEIERQRFETIADEYEKTVSAQAEERLEKSGIRRGAGESVCGQRAGQRFIWNDRGNGGIGGRCGGMGIFCRGNARIR